MSRRSLPEAVWTIGHSTHPIESFIAMLLEHGIESLVDIRRFAGSRRNSQFSPQALQASIDAAGLRYLPMPGLGGRRKPAPDSLNDAWRNDAFRGYADYMETDEYRRAFDELIDESVTSRCAIMCSEAVWWRCHRGLVADDLKVRGVKVLHIMGAGAAKEHPFTAAATVVDGKLSYAQGDDD